MPMSPRVMAIAAGLVLVLGPVVMIQVYRGTAAPAEAGVVPSIRLDAPPRKRSARMEQPEAQAPATPAEGGARREVPAVAAGAEPAAALLFEPPVPGSLPFFVRPASEASTVSPEPGRFGPRAPAARSAAGPGSPRHAPGSGAAPMPSAGTPRVKVTRSASCDSTMPEDSWLDICG